MLIRWKSRYCHCVIWMLSVLLVNGQDSNPSCDVFNGGCSDVCTPSSRGITCSCPANQTLANNDRVCVAKGSSCDRRTDFTCIDGSCIPIQLVCDTQRDCLDGSDETDNYCYDNTCSADQFSCANGRCINDRFTCDYFNDCGDNSDEQNCTFPTCDPVTAFTCLSGRCVAIQAVCNGFDECQDGNATDEQNCPDRTCPSGFQQCPNNNICISPLWLCDGENDCGDRSDEESLFCASRTCSPESFQCDSGRCIPGSWYCDGTTDCRNGEDEPQDYCSSPEFTCHPGLFTCRDGTCITAEWECDGIAECPDGSDEYHLCEEYVCPENFYKCDIKKHEKNRCIPISQVCDGVTDCEKGDDEFQNCTLRTCSDLEFPCRNGLCIPLAFACDHDNDCGDQSDEGSDCTYARCDDETQFTCNNGRCVPASWRCDGTDDCRDGSDEINCATEEPTCPPGQFRCNSGECIQQDLVCNSQRECADNSDEFRCGVNECDIPQLNRCQQDCVNTATGFYCSCQDGYRLNPDGITCAEINECEETPEVCSQLCVNTNGSYNCKCVAGYIKDIDGRTCRHESGGDPLILFSNYYYVRSLSTDGRDYTLVADNLRGAVGLDFDYAEDLVYVMDVVQSKIIRMTMNGTNRETIIEDFVSGGEGIAVDWVGRKIYWVDRVADVMEVAELDGSARKTLVYSGLDQPRAVAVHPKYGYVFWTDWGLDSYIGRVSMDGNNRTRFHDNKMVWPNGLTIDYTTDRLYWCDAHLDYIAYSDLDGGDIRILPAVAGQEVAHPFALSLFENYVYWTDWNYKTIYRADKLTSENSMTYVETIQIPFDIHIYHPLRQDQTLINPCGNNNGGCSHLCLIAAGGQSYTCACPDSLVLLDDEATCQTVCASNQFRCANNEKCIPLSWRCDTEPDCSDGSDEPDDCPIRHCPDRVFQCDNNNCVASTELCDSYNDCGDGSDESHCNATACLPWQFRCNSGSCINHVLTCNGNPDCFDGSDEMEELCASHECAEGYFKCDSGFCIPATWVCDLDNDCGDNSDEPLRQCQSQTTCPSGWFSCVSNYRCVPSWAVCNGFDDCRDNSDEEACDEATCDAGEFSCFNGGCIPQRWICDFDNDCGDYSDEEACLYRPCSESEYRCLSDLCIPKRWICDFEEDCPDGEDELACLETTCPFPDQFQCESGHCIHQENVCDGISDCQDASDEINCPTRLPGGLYCFPSQFTCDDTVCLPLSWRCDGTQDCPDGSDENLALCTSIPCDTEDRWRCDNGFCIPRSALCDGIDTCGDASDENNHDFCAEVRQCTEDEFKCRNGECIPEVWVCDLEDDCGDLSDENGCHPTGSCSVDNGGCEVQCNPLAGDGYYCSCGDGLQLADDRMGCDDINECETNPCMQVCSNSKGNYSCSCAEGYVDEGNRGLDCKAAGESGYYFFGQDDEIRYFFDRSRVYEVLATTQGSIQALDYNFDQAVVYWIDSDIQALMRARIPASDETANPDNLRINGLNRPQDLAVDWLSGNIYWTDLGEVDEVDTSRKRRSTSGTPCIATAKSDGRYPHTLVDSDIDAPTAIVVNPRRGVLYWTDTGASPKIEMVWMNGENRLVLVNTSIVQPSGLSIDFSNYDTVYWCDQSRNSIESMSWDGSNRKVLRASPALNRPRQLEVFESYIYFTTAALDSGEIRQMDKLGRGVSETKFDNINEPRGLRIFQQQRYPADIPNRCQGTVREHCSHLCFITPIMENNMETRGFSCGCPDGDRLQRGDDNHCHSARLEERPLPDPIPNCPCLNGGFCQDDGTCMCIGDWTGENCAAQKQTAGGLNAGATAGIAVGVALVVLIVAVSIFIYIRRRTGIVKTPKDEGRVSYRTGTNVELPFQPDMGPNDPTTFENPVYANAGTKPDEAIYMNDEELRADGWDPNTGLPKAPLPDGGAVMMSEKAGPPPGGIDASQLPPPPQEMMGGGGQMRVMVPLPEMDLQTPPQSPAYSPAEEEGDKKNLVFRDDM